MPVLGYLDDLVLLPLGIVLAIRLLPPAVLAECRTRAQAHLQDGKPVSRVAAVVIVVIWLGLAALGLAWGWRYWSAGLTQGRPPGAISTASRTGRLLGDCRGRALFA